MLRKVVLSFAVLLCLSTAAQAAMSIVVGSHQLLANTANQVVQIFVTGDGTDFAAGLNFRVQVGDGGPGVGGIDDIGPMTGSIIAPGEMFQPNNTGANDGSAPPGYVDLQTTTSSGTIPVAGLILLGTLTFDTTGYGPSPIFPLIMSNTLGGPTDFAGLPIAIQDGDVQIIPEPSSVVLGLFGLAGLGAVAIRRRRARA